MKNKFAMMFNLLFEACIDIAFTIQRVVRSILNQTINLFKSISHWRLKNSCYMFSPLVAYVRHAYDPCNDC